MISGRGIKGTTSDRSGVPSPSVNHVALSSSRERRASGRNTERCTSVRRKYSATLTVTVLFLLAGCTDEPRPWEDISGSRVRDLTNEEVVEIERAEQKLIKTCMKDEGFPYWEFPVAGIDERKSGNYVIESVRWAEAYGYGREF